MELVQPKISGCPIGLYIPVFSNSPPPHFTCHELSCVPLPTAGPFMLSYKPLVGPFYGSLQNPSNPHESPCRTPRWAHYTSSFADPLLDFLQAPYELLRNSINNSSQINNIYSSGVSFIP